VGKLFGTVARAAPQALRWSSVNNRVILNTAQNIGPKLRSHIFRPSNISKQAYQDISGPKTNDAYEKAARDLLQTMLKSGDMRWTLRQNSAGFKGCFGSTGMGILVNPDFTFFSFAECGR
jgi:hypothetical protein